MKCPREFYYRYKLKLKTKPSIHLVRGNIVHKALERFFKLRLYENVSDSFSALKNATLNLFNETWKDYSEELNKLNMPPQDIDFCYDDSKKMVLNWLHTFLKEDPKELRPLTELKLESNTHQVYAIVDIIKNSTGVPHIVDYKTSKSMELTDEYRLQLAIQALCYHERRGALNFRVGIHFLKFPDGMKMFTPTVVALKEAIKKINHVRGRIESDDIKDYPCTCPGWCKRNYIFENGKDTIIAPKVKTSLPTHRKTVETVSNI